MAYIEYWCVVGCGKATDSNLWIKGCCPKCKHHYPGIGNSIAE